MKSIILFLLLSVSTASTMTIEFHDCNPDTIDDSRPIADAYIEAFSNLDPKASTIDYNFVSLVLLNLKGGTSNLLIDRMECQIIVHVHLDYFDPKKLIKLMERIVTFSFYSIDTNNFNTVGEG